MIMIIIVNTRTYNMRLVAKSNLRHGKSPDGEKAVMSGVY